MKKMLSFLLAMLMLLGAMPAMAEDAIRNPMPDEIAALFDVPAWDGFDVMVSDSGWAAWVYDDSMDAGVAVMSNGSLHIVCLIEPDSKGNLYVRVGVMKLQSNLSYLRLAGEQAAAPKTRRNGVSRPTEMRTATISPELDVRGETIDEAVYRIEKQLSDALLSSLTEVRIIHGKGTGALRNGIHAWLRTQPYIAEFHLASFGEGDAGVTVVRLK